MFHNVDNRNASLKVSIQHLANQIYALLRKWEIGDTKRVVEYLIDIVEWILLVDDGVQKNAECPNVLFFASIWSSLKNLGCSVI